MKNRYVLPTDTPSRLFLNKVNNKLLLEDIANPNLKKVLPSGTYQNIYITNSEEIKDGTWVIQKNTGKFMFLAFTRSDSYNKNKDLKEEFSKIILSTDQDLIKDGVQAIDNEFLEWFVKNSSCEEVEVRQKPKVKAVVKGLGIKSFNNGYRIVIPK